MNRRGTIPAIALGVSILGLVAVVVFALLPKSTSGSPTTTPAMAAKVKLQQIGAKFAKQPGAAYHGSITVNGKTLNLDGLRVSAAADAQGDLKAGSDSARYIRVNGGSYAMGSKGFWQQQDIKTTIDLSGFETMWAKLSPSSFPDLGSLLATSNLGFALTNDERSEQIGDGQGSTPNARERITGAEPNIRQEGEDTIVAADLRTTYDKDLNITGVKGPLQTTSGATATVDLTIKPLSSDDVSTLYGDIGGKSAALASVYAPYVKTDLNEQRTSSSTCTGDPCPYEGRITATAPGVNEPITVSGSVDVYWTVGTRQGPKCKASFSLPLGGSTTFRCDIAQTGGLTTFRVSVDARFSTKTTVDVNAVNTAVKADQITATAAGSAEWRQVGVKPSKAGRQYNLQITGVPSSVQFVVGGYGFDGRAPDGTLLMTYGPGTGSSVDSLIAEGRKQVSAAGDKKVRWVFAEQASADAATRALQSAGVTIESVYVPAMSGS